MRLNSGGYCMISSVPVEEPWRTWALPNYNKTWQGENRTPWWRHQMETFSALLAICAGNSPVPGEFPTQRPVTRSFDVYFDLRPNKRLGKQSLGWWFETLSPPLWRHRNDILLGMSYRWVNQGLREYWSVWYQNVDNFKPKWEVVTIFRLQLHFM